MVMLVGDQRLLRFDVLHVGIATTDDDVVLSSELDNDTVGLSEMAFVPAVDID